MTTIGPAPPAGSGGSTPAAVNRDDSARVSEVEPAPARGTWRRRLGGALQDRLPPTLRAAAWALDGMSVLVIAALGVVAVLAAVLLFSADPRTETLTKPTFAAASATAAGVGGAPASPPAEPTEPSTLVVHIAGLVAAPGVYELPVGSRVVDAIQAAGGAIEGTDLSQLNLARIVVDGEQVAVGVPPAPRGGAGATPGGPVTDGSAPIDLNLATEAELDSLPGVGPVLAARIVAWRQANGRFSSVEELLEVTGIGVATLADIAPLVQV